MSERQCPECKTTIIGRADKRFCSDQCRNGYHNRLNRDSINLVRNINNALRRNRRILETLNSKGKTVVKRRSVMEKGYDPRYMTEHFITKDGKRYFFCYDQGYLELDKDTLMLVNREQD